MSLPNNNQNQVNSGTDASNPILATPIARYPPFRHNPRSSAFNSYSYTVGFGIPNQNNITPFRPLKRVMITYSYEYDDQPIAANHYSLINSGTATSATFPGLLYDGSHNNSMIYQQNASAFGDFGPRAPSVPFVGARVSYYEGPSTVIPRVASSSVSQRGRRRPREEPQVQSTTDQAAGSSQSVQMHGLVARENIRGSHKCPECGRTFKSGPALGGHMRHHAKRRREEQERRITETDP